MNQKKFEKLLKDEEFVKGILSQKDAKQARFFFDKYKLEISDDEIKEFYSMLSDILRKIDRSELSGEELDKIGGGSNNIVLRDIVFQTVSKFREIDDNGIRVIPRD